MTHDYTVCRDKTRKSVWHVYRRYDGSEELIDTYYSEADAKRAARLLNRVLKVLREEFEQLQKDQEQKNDQS
jgi:hypothetical protein